MAIFPSIRELFGTPAPAAPLSPAQQTTAAAANAQGQMGSAASPGQVDNNATIPNAATMQSDGTTKAFPAAGKGEASPLENYKDIWLTPANPNSASSSLVPTITADPEKMMAAARTLDFTKGMDPTLLEAASKGDSSALAAVINSAAQNAYAQGATATVSIATKMLQEQANSFTTKFAPNMLRNASIADAVESAIPLSADPAAAPVVNALTTQLANKFPTASSKEIADHVENYLQDFAKRVVEGKGGKITSSAELAASTPALQRKDTTDWSAYFGIPADSMN